MMHESRIRYFLSVIRFCFYTRLFEVVWIDFTIRAVCSIFTGRNTGTDTVFVKNKLLLLLIFL